MRKRTVAVARRVQRDTEPAVRKGIDLSAVVEGVRHTNSLVAAAEVAEHHSRRATGVVEAAERHTHRSAEVAAVAERHTRRAMTGVAEAAERYIPVASPVAGEGHTPGVVQPLCKYPLRLSFLRVLGELF